VMAAEFSARVTDILLLFHAAGVVVNRG